MPGQKTLALDRTVWDLVIDTKGNIAVVTNPYSIAQDVATALRCFRGESWYDISLGIPYLTDVFSFAVPLSLVAVRLEEEALRVPHVITARAVFTKNDTQTRVLEGAMLITDDLGNEMRIGL